MSEVDFVAQDVDVEHFPHVFPFLIRGELASFLKMLADVCHFLVYALSLVLFVIAIPNISYKLREAAHCRHDLWDVRYGESYKF